jgi:NRPS condensation-like uncharacterized protein
MKTNAKRKEVPAVEVPAVNLDAPAKPAKPAFKLSAEQAKAVAAIAGVSDRIRYLTKQALTRAQITQVIPNAKGGKLRYQHVRNVQVQDEENAKAKAEAAKSTKSAK